MPQTTAMLPSGARLEIQSAPFALACKLRRTAASAFIAVDVSTPMEELQKGKFSLNDLKGLLLQALGNEQLENDLNACLKYCLYNEAKVDAATFDNARGDYLPALWEVAQFNLAPFFGSLSSLFSAFVIPTTSGQK